MTVRVSKYYRKGKLEGIIIEKNGTGLLLSLEEAEKFFEEAQKIIKTLEEYNCEKEQSWLLMKHAEMREEVF